MTKPVFGNTDNSNSIVYTSGKDGWFRRKMDRIKGGAGNKYVAAKQGFILGCVAGGLLGVVFGGITAVKMKSFAPIPFSMATSGLFFGGVFSVSSAFRS